MQEPLRKCSAPVPCFKPKLGEAIVNKENQKNGNHRKNQKEITEILFHLKACVKKKDLREGIKVHAHILQRGFLAKNAHLGSSLVCMYAKCGDLVKAEQVFNELPTKNVVAWNARITGCIQCGQASDAIKCFKKMKESGISPDVVTFTCILKACGIAGSLSCGKHIHDEILNGGYWGKDVMLGNALIDMYAKCDNLSKAREILDELPIQNVVSWNGMVGGYVKQGKHIEALGCFQEMKNKGFSPDPITFSCALVACANLKELRKGKEIHNEIVTTGLLEKNAILGTALVDMYAKCGMLKTAHQVLNQICIRDVVSWNALIAGYAQCGEAEEAMRCFNEMKCEDIPPNAVTFSCILKVCGSAGALREGKHVHDEIIQKKLLGKNVVLGTGLVDMYAKCGALRKARKVLDDLAMRDVVTWSSLIAGYAQQGEGEKTLECFKEMEHEGIAPNTITFRSLLQACSYSGLVEEGQMLFTVMSKIYGIIPDLEHHACLVDLFGRAGHFDKVMTIITKIPSSDYPPLWGAVLGMCQKWGNVKLGRLAFEQSVQFNEMNDAAYACMNNIYVAAGMLDDAKEIEAIRRKNFSEEETKYAYLCGS